MTKEQYFRITNENNDKEGLDIYDGIFNENDRTIFPITGLCFSTSNQLHNYYGNGCYVREVFLPENENFKMVKSFGMHGDTYCGYRANMLILGKRYNLFDIDTIIDLDLEVTNDFLNKIACRNDVKLLKYAHRLSHYTKYMCISTMETIIENKWYDMLNFLKSKKYRIHCYDFEEKNPVIEQLKKYGHVVSFVGKNMNDY